jgi:hypothetical protein
MKPSDKSETGRRFGAAPLLGHMDGVFGFKDSRYCSPELTAIHPACDVRHGLSGRRMRMNLKWIYVSIGKTSRTNPNTALSVVTKSGGGIRGMLLFESADGKGASN